MNFDSGNAAETLLRCVVLMSLAFLPQVLSKPYRAGMKWMDMKCTDASTGRQLLIGDAFTRPGQCIRVQCLGNLSLWEDRCQKPRLAGNCNQLPAANEYLDYPKCCPLYQCRTYETGEAGETEETRTYDHAGILKKTHITQVFVITQPFEGLVSVPGNGIKTQFEI